MNELAAGELLAEPDLREPQVPTLSRLADDDFAPVREALVKRLVGGETSWVTVNAFSSAL